MLGHPAAWNTLATSGAAVRPVARVTAWGAGGATIDIPVTDGYVLKDAGQFPRTHVQVTCADTSLIPSTVNALLSPLSQASFLRVELGYVNADGLTAYITVSDGPITRVMADRPGGLLQIEASDPSLYPAGLTWNVDIPPTITPAYQQAYVWALDRTSRFTGTDTSALTGAQLAIPVPTGYVWKAGATAWAQVEALMDLLGAEAYFAPDRRLVFRPTPTVGSPVYTFQTGEGGTLTGYQTTLERTYNAVYLNYSSGISGVWLDRDPSSPMNIYNGYGIYALSESRTGTPSQVDADAAAKEYARRARGTGRTLAMRAVPVPWLEPGDTVNVSPIGLPTEQHVIQSVSIPLGLDVMTVTTRNPVYTGIL